MFWVSQYITAVQMTGDQPAAARLAHERHGRLHGMGRLPAIPDEGRQADLHRRHRQPPLGGLCDALGFDDWKKRPELNSNKKRGAQKPRIAERITEAVEKLTYDDIAERLYKGLVPYAPVNSPARSRSTKGR